MDKKPHESFWVLWITIFLTVLGLLGYGIYNADELLRTALIFAAAIWVILFILLVIGKGMSKPRKKRSVVTTDAKVFSKTTEVTGVDFTVTRYHVSFEIPDGTRHSFRVFVNQYNTIAEGETGILTYKEQILGLKLISFERHI